MDRTGVPETAVHEAGDLGSLEDDVAASPAVAEEIHLEAIPEASTMKLTAQC